MIFRKTRKKIKKDFVKTRKRIKNAKSLQGITKKQRLTYPKLVACLSIFFEKIIQKFSKSKKSNSNTSQKKNNITSKSPLSTKVVLDASITRTQNLTKFLDALSSYVFILTNMTIVELNKLKKYPDISGNNARYILNLATKKQDKFEVIFLEETKLSVDDSIVQYCVDNIDTTLLLTADKGMASNAKKLGVETKYIDCVGNISEPKFNLVTLFSARMLGNKLLISTFTSARKSIRVLSNDKTYEEGLIELKSGDNILIASNKKDYITFSHYKIISIRPENNCQLIFSKRIYERKDINSLPKAEYKNFIRNFNHNLQNQLIYH